jgi:hypothetical protein
MVVESTNLEPKDTVYCMIWFTWNCRKKTNLISRAESRSLWLPEDGVRKRDGLGRGRMELSRAIKIFYALIVVVVTFMYTFVKTVPFSWGAACLQSSYWGGRGRRIKSLRSAWAKLGRPCFKEIQTKWGHNSRQSSCLICVRPWVQIPVITKKKKKKNSDPQSGVLVPPVIPATWEAEAGGSLEPRSSRPAG